MPSGITVSSSNPSSSAPSSSSRIAISASRKRRLPKNFLRFFLTPGVAVELCNGDVILEDVVAFCTRYLSSWSKVGSPRPIGHPGCSSNCSAKSISEVVTKVLILQSTLTCSLHQGQVPLGQAGCIQKMSNVKLRSHLIGGWRLVLTPVNFSAIQKNFNWFSMQAGGFHELLSPLVYLLLVQKFDDGASLHFLLDPLNSIGSGNFLYR